MPKELDIATWDRKHIYNFFKDFDEPFFGVTVEIDCTKAYSYCKEQGHSFFLYYLHCSTLAANGIEGFKFRIINNKVMVYDQVNASATINRPNGTFGFSFILFDEDFTTFTETAKQEIDRVQQSDGLVPAVSGENVIHYSSLPWLKFTGLSHARHYAFKDSCPKISFGKMTEEHGKKIMPVSIHVHHALMDGSHVGQYVESFQKLMDRENNNEIH
ncbi:MAG: chloramphenicol acetyltransferase [Bacteroidota bacterium]